MKNVLLIVMLLAQSVAMGQTQQATTESGKKVILSADGTWKYTEQKKDTLNTNLSDCSNWIKVTTDKVTGNSSTSARNTIVISTDDGESGLGIFMMQGSRNTLVLIMQAVGASNCIDKGGRVNILFDDGSRLELKADSDFNCKGKATIYFGDVFRREKELSELKNKKIATMRVWTTDGYVERDLTQENKDDFLNIINCLMK